MGGMSDPSSDLQAIIDPFCITDKALTGYGSNSAYDSNQGGHLGPVPSPLCETLKDPLARGNKNVGSIRHYTQVGSIRHYTQVEAQGQQQRTNTPRGRCVLRRKGASREPRA